MKSRTTADTGRPSKSLLHVANRRSSSHPPEVGYQIQLIVDRYRPAMHPGAPDQVDIILTASTAAGRRPPVHPMDRALRMSMRLTLEEARHLLTMLSNTLERK